MFPSVKAKDQSKQKQKNKDKQWDQKIINKSGLPEYSPLRDKHTASYKKTLINNSAAVGNYNDTEAAINKKIKQKTYFQKKLDLLSRIKDKNNDDYEQIKNYEDLMNKSGAPNFYSYYSLMPLLKIGDAKLFLLNATKKLKQKGSPYHRISTAIRAREQCIQRLKKSLHKAKQVDILKQKTKFKNQINHLRLLTANVIQQIRAWRDELGQMQQKAVYFSDDQKNYLIEMLNDNKFIFNYKLADFINFGQKNDPFIIAPLKKSQGKQHSQFMQIVASQKQLSYYQKYMDYLASQKASQVNLLTDSANKKANLLIDSPNKKMKSSSIAKTYATAKQDTNLLVVEEKINESQDIEAIQKQRQRQQRLKKNQQKINSIKSIYQTYASRKKGTQSQKKLAAETDIDEKRQTFRVKKQKKQQGNETDFQGLVKLKMQQSQKAKSKQTKIKKSKQKQKQKQKHAKSANKLPKHQQKMIDNLRQIQQSLKSKLQIVKKEDKMEQSIFTTTKYSRKNNEQLVKQLKMEIIQKIEKETQEKQKLKKKKREQQQKALQQIKQKMKKQMEQKLQQKKREKILQRQQLQKRLKQQEQRLNNQRQMELQLQMKLNKEKQMRQLEKLRRQSLQKQKKYKQQLQKQQKLRKQKEQAVQKQRREKQRILEQLKKKELKQQIQEDLKKQMMEKKKIQNQSTIREQMQAIKKQKQEQLSKQIQLLKLKEKDQLNILEKEAAIRQKMLKLKKQEQQLKRKQVQALMKNVIQRQKQDIDRDALQKRVQLEQDLRANIKQKLLQQYKNQRQAAIQVNRNKRQKQLQQQVYREKVRQKIQREMRIQAINRTKKDLQQRQSKKYQMRTKLENIKLNIENNNKVDKDKIQQEVKKDVIQRVIFDKNMQRQNAKMALRAQFQKQLLSSAIPQMYQAKDSFLLKRTDQLAQDNNLARRMQLTGEKPTNQRPFYDQKEVSKSQIRDVRKLITNEQLQIYSKQKSKVNQMREDPDDKPPVKYIQQKEEGYQLMNPDRKKKASDDQYDIKIVRKEKEKQQQQKFQKKKKKRKAKHSQSEQSDQQKKKKSKAKKKKKKAKKSQSEKSQVDSEDEPKIKQKKQTKNKKKQQQDSDEKSSQQQVKQKSPVKKRIQFDSEVQKKQVRKSIMKSQKKKQAESNQQQKQSKVVVHYDADKRQIKQPNFNQIQPITIKKNFKQVQDSNKFEISLDAIPQSELDQYLQGHFSRLPQDQINIQTYDRQELYRKLIGQLTFCLLLGHHQGKLIGMAFAYHDRSRTDIRKFVIVHFGTYKTDDLRQFVINASNYIFKKDPCDEVEFHYKFNQSIKQQLNFSTQFNLWFDRYGNVYQKKLQQTHFQRKYILKRQFNQKCEVVLGGVNKNTFRNIFSVYSGVMMSDADMVIFKQQLRDVISPQDEISYAILIAQLFRTYLTPDEAEALKSKVKQFVKLKQLLVLVVMLQKKKVKMDQLKLYQYKSLIQLNMRLMSQGKDVIRYCKDSGIEHNRVFFCELNHGFNLPFNFQTTSLPVETKQSQIRQISYFRLSALPPYKLHIIKSSIYNGQMNILPTQNSKYKLFIMNAQQYMQVKESNKMDLFMYIRLFLKNVKSHNVAVWKYVWMPEMMDKGSWNIRQFKSFLNKDIYAHDSVNISYRQFLPGALIIEPQHRDLVITPPFIVGIMSMTLEQVTEGSPLYARLIDIDALRTIQIQK